MAHQCAVAHSLKIADLDIDLSEAIEGGRQVGRGKDSKCEGFSLAAGGKESEGVVLKLWWESWVLRRDRKEL